MKILSETYETVKAEMTRRAVDLSGNLPIRVVKFPATLEVLYVQESPPLGAWAQYNTIAELDEVFDQLTAKRLRPGSRFEIKAEWDEHTPTVREGNNRL
jgi:hypothetical protein